MLAGEGSLTPKTIRDVWAAAWQFAQGDSRILVDVKRASALDPMQTRECDFMRECAWAIFGARYSYDQLAKLWPSLEEAFRYWSVVDIVAQRDAVRTKALGILNNAKKVDAVLDIAQWLSTKGWPAVFEHIVQGAPSDDRGNLVPTKELIDWLDHLPYIGPTLALYVMKNLGFGSLKDDGWMRCLARHLSYPADQDGVWRMALDTQSFAGEKLNVMDTVLWNWAKHQKWLKQP